MPCKISKHEGKGDPEKHLNKYKTQMSLKRASPAVKCRVFYLTLSGATEVRPLSIKCWLDLKRCFFKSIFVIKGRRSPNTTPVRYEIVQGEMFKNYLVRFPDEINYYEQITDKEAILALKGDLNTNALF